MSTISTVNTLLAILDMAPVCSIIAREMSGKSINSVIDALVVEVSSKMTDFEQEVLSLRNKSITDEAYISLLQKERNELKHKLLTVHIHGTDIMEEDMSVGEIYTCSRCHEQFEYQKGMAYMWDVEQSRTLLEQDDVDVSDIGPMPALEPLPSVVSDYRNYVIDATSFPKKEEDIAAWLPEWLKPLTDDQLVTVAAMELPEWLQEARQVEVNDFKY